MSFGILFDFTGNSNVSRITKAADMVQQKWFLDAVNSTKDIDLFLLLGHNPARTTVSGSTFKIVMDAIKKIKPATPIQVFGGHTHIRDFAVYDDKSTGLESGKSKYFSNLANNSNFSRTILRNARMVINERDQVKLLQGSTETERSAKSYEKSIGQLYLGFSLFSSLSRLESTDLRLPRRGISRQDFRCQNRS